MKKIVVIGLLFAMFSVSAQVKIGSSSSLIHEGAILELESSGTKGLKFPQIALSSTSLWAPLAGIKVMGMTVYNTATTGDVSPGLYTNDGIVWVKNQGAPAIGLFGHPTRLVSSLSPITWLVDDVVIVIIAPNVGPFNLPSASANSNRIVGISNRTNGTRNVTQTGDTGVYANDASPSIQNTSCTWFISDGTSWRVYAGRL